MRNAFWLLAAFMVALLFMGLCSGGPLHVFHPLKGTQLLVADLDDDARLDLTTVSGKELQSVRNRGRGRVSQPVTHALKTEQDLEPVATPDLNGDGRPDLVSGTGQLWLAEDSGGYRTVGSRLEEPRAFLAETLAEGQGCELLLVYKRKPLGGEAFFELVRVHNLPSVLEGAEPRYQRLARTSEVSHILSLQADGDSRREVLTVHPEEEKTLTLWDWNEDGNGLEQVSQFGEQAPEQILVQDINADQREDILYPVPEQNKAKVWLNVADNRFSQQLDLDFPAVPHRLALGHLDEDSHLDLAVAWSQTSGRSQQVTLYSGTASGRYSERESWDVKGHPLQLEVVDLDGSQPHELFVLSEAGGLESFTQKN